MKTLLIILSLFVIVSCGKKSSDSTTKKEVSPLETLDLSYQKFTQMTGNGTTYVKFDKAGGEIKVYINYGMTMQPLFEKDDLPATVIFNFTDYALIEENIIELSGISLKELVGVKGCNDCNTPEAISDAQKHIERYYEDVLSKNKTIRIEISKINNKNYNFLLNIGWDEVIYNESNEQL